MTGGDNDSARRTLAFHGKRNSRRGSGVRGDLYGNASAGDNLSRNASGLLRKKARVIAHDNPAARILMPQDVSCNAACDTADVVKGKVAGNKAAPAVGAKFNIAHWSLVVGRWPLALTLRLNGLDLANDRRPTTNGNGSTISHEIP